ncbi:MAG TPA: cytochrome c family protein [Geminicoccaceae bacterium]|nr:cytochrome c family protein [Geminicoccaceae bacterium]
MLKKKNLLALALAGALGGIGGTAAAEGDPAKGERLFVRCKACHVVDATTNRVGPHLVGLFGRHAGEVEGFNYSDAMKNADIVWDEETIDAYLADPRGYIAGNKMAFPGLKKEEERADVIAYLKEATQAQ